MSKLTDRARELRAIESPHYNCAQASVIPFAEEAGIDAGTAMRFAANFGGGMRRASVCGAVTGGLMALGLFGVDDPGTVAEYHRRIKEKHAGMLDCADLLRANAEAGLDKKTHCDAMIAECVSVAESILKEKGKYGMSGKKGINEFVKECMAKEGAILVDVREEDEFGEGHIPGAVNIPIGRIARIEDEADEDTPIYVYCLSGVRSARAASVLTAMGYTAAVSIGGINAYTGPIEK